MSTQVCRELEFVFEFVIQFVVIFLLVWEGGKGEASFVHFAVFCDEVLSCPTILVLKV